MKLLEPYHVRLVCNKLKDKKKAAGYDDITAEYFKYTGETGVLILTKIFNSIICTEKIPPQFKIGVIIPVPKGDKDRTNMDNNRGITLMTCFRKVFEKSIMEKVTNWG